MQHLPQQAIENASGIAYIASAATTSIGLITWFNQNAQAIGALCAIGGLLVAAATFALNWYYKHKAVSK
jgi:hypothetical protein